MMTISIDYKSIDLNNLVVVYSFQHLVDQVKQNFKDNIKGAIQVKLKGLLPGSTIVLLDICVKLSTSIVFVLNTTDFLFHRKTRSADDVIEYHWYSRNNPDAPVKIQQKCHNPCRVLSSSTERRVPPSRKCLFPSTTTDIPNISLSPHLNPRIIPIAQIWQLFLAKEMEFQPVNVVFSRDQSRSF